METTDYTTTRGPGRPIGGKKEKPTRPRKLAARPAESYRSAKRNKVHERGYLAAGHKQMRGEGKKPRDAVREAVKAIGQMLVLQRALRASGQPGWGIKTGPGKPTLGVMHLRLGRAALYKLARKKAKRYVGPFYPRNKHPRNARAA